MSHEVIDIAGRECFVYAHKDPQYILIQTLGNHERGVFDRTVELISQGANKPFALVAFEINDWDLELTPWFDPAINRDPKVGTVTGETLKYVTDSLIPELQKRYGNKPVILGGYSLGGLFALWAASQTDQFEAIAAASPSVWIRDWLKFAKKNPVRTSKVYLSLGDREEHVKNQSIARVGDSIRGEYELLKQQLGEQNCTLEWNPGGHFQDEDRRLASAFIWCVN